MTLDPASTRMVVEAAESPEVVARQLVENRALIDDLAARLRHDPPRLVATVARGSSDHAATYLKHLVETRLGLPVISIAPSVSSLYGLALGGADMLAIALSQSGASPDLVATMRAAQSAGADTLALVNTLPSPLADLARTVVPLRAGAETSVAATKSLVATLAASLALVAAWSGDADLARARDALPDQLHAAWECDWSRLIDTLADAPGLYVIGRGPGFGIAQEAALKFKETCGLHAEAFSAAEVRHGPMALVGPDFPLLVFRQDDVASAGIDALVADAARSGAPVLVTTCDRRNPPVTALSTPDAAPITAPILSIHAFYRALNTLSVRRGHDPDRPPALRKVTETI